MGGGQPAEMNVDEALVTRLASEATAAGSSSLLEAKLRALCTVYSDSSDDHLAMNVFALDAMISEKTGDWGRDGSAAVEAAAKLRAPLLLVDIPQEWTFAEVMPVYNRKWREDRARNAEYLRDTAKSLQFMEAEQAIMKDCILSGRGASLAPLSFGISVCRPIVGGVEV